QLPDGGDCAIQASGGGTGVRVLRAVQRRPGGIGAVRISEALIPPMDIWAPLLLSLKVALWATGLNLLLGTAVAYGLSRWRSPMAELIDSLLTLPLVLPPTVLGYYLLVILGRHGVLGAW